MAGELVQGPKSHQIIVWRHLHCTAGIGFGDHCAFIYTAEMAPPRWRGRLNTLVQLGTITGIVVANAINIATNNLQWGWRLSLGLAALPGTVLVMGEPSLSAFLCKFPVKSFLTVPSDSETLCKEVSVRKNRNARSS